MSCNCNPNFHKTLTLTQSETNLVATVSNSTNISSFTYFELVLCQCPNRVITGDPLPVVLTINGENASLLNKYSLPIYSNRLKPRKKYYGAYVVPTTGTPYVILWNTPDCPMYAISEIAPATTTETTGD